MDLTAERNRSFSTPLPYVTGSQPIEVLGSKVAAEFVAKRDGRKDDVQLVGNGDKKFCPYCGRLLLLNGGRFPAHTDTPERELREVNSVVCKGSGKEYEVVSVVREKQPPMTAPALNDYLIRKFSISPQRLRGPMPIELRDFHRNNLASLFAELGFKRGAEIGVAEGKFSEILCKANPDLNLLCVDPWHSYKDNPQSKTKEKDEFAYREAQRRLAPYPNVTLDMRLSMDAVRGVLDGSLDFVSIDGHHGFRFVMMDLLCWSMKVRQGGIILLDDYMYLDRKRWGAGVVEAVQAFASANEINPWFICDADRSVDAFFVKGDWK